MLHELVTNDKYAEYDLIVHHIYIVNRENRHQAEAKAVKSIVPYYKKIKDFLYTESVFNTSGFAPLKSIRFPFDMDVCAFLAANICAARPEVAHVAMGRTKTDVSSGGSNFSMRMQRAQNIFKSTLMLQGGEMPEYIFPVVDMTKEEIWNNLPETVRPNTWYCRTPLYTDNMARPCGKCITCKDVQSFING